MSSLHKPPLSRILIDSNAYFRLAQSIHPLLCQEFGSKRYCLYIIDGFEKEYFRNSRLQTSFSWVQQEEYIENRKKKIERNRTQVSQIKFNKEYLWATARELELTTSPIDVEALAVAMELGVPVVTDDTDMLVLAKEYDIKTLKTLELLKLMLEESHISEAIIDAITAYWDYSKDYPKNFLVDFRRIFNREPKRA